MRKFSCSFATSLQMCDPINIHWVTIENQWLSQAICCFFTAIQWVLVGSQIRIREVKEQLKLDNLSIDHVTIRPELKYLFGAKVIGTRKWNSSPVPIVPYSDRFISNPGGTPALVTQSGSLVVVGPDQGLQVHLHSRMIKTSKFAWSWPKCTSEFTLSQLPSVSLNSLDYSL